MIRGEIRRRLARLYVVFGVSMALPSNVIAFPSPKTNFGPRRAKRYGKATSAIRSRQAKAYEQAVDRAAAIPGLSFVFVTATWDLTGRAALDDIANVLWLREAVRKWLWHRGVQFFDLGARENDAAKGPHWHWLVHCPAYLRKALRSYIKAQLSPSRKGGAKIMKLPRLADCDGCHGHRNWQHLARSYFLKGSTDTVRQRNGIDLCASASDDAAKVYCQSQGTITGKRLFHSRSLGDKAHRVRVGGAHRSQPQPAPAAAALIASDKS